MPQGERLSRLSSLLGPDAPERRARDPLPPPRRSSPERPPPPRRLDEKPLPPPAAALIAYAERRWRTDVLLEAARLAADYLVTQGVLPEHVIHAREDPSPKQHHILHARDDPKLDGTRAICEVTEIPGDPPGEHACDSLPDLVGQMSQQAYYDPPDNHVQDKHADENQNLEDDQLLLNQGIGMHDLDKNYQNSEQMLVNQRANEHGHGDQQPESEQMLLNNEEAMLKQDAEEQVENE
ncbi:hypothetical protein ZWY2020_058257 [Hordeum vulgare]|nr:hypothetical protein ZWY2020_058257 [Hordeum vulgare]